MDRKAIKELVKEVLGPNTPMEDQERWVSICCPLAHWKHVGGADHHPSAGISVKEDGDPSIFNCFTCHSRGTVSWLLRKLEGYTGEDWSGMADALEKGEFFGGSIPQWGQVDRAEQIHPIEDAATYLDLYESAVGHPYLKRRGITNWAARQMNLLVDPGDNGGAERILFPVYGWYDKALYGFSGRAVSKTTALRVKDYFGLPKRHLLLGAQLIAPDDKFVTLVEGLVDVAKLVGYGYPALGFMSSTLTEFQAEILRDIGKPVYFIHDNDAAGVDARERARELLWRYVPVMKVRYPTECTVETPEGDLRPPEDPAELTGEQVGKMIEEARLL